ncbi:MAG: flagellar biosynthesis protein FlhA [Deltaproteobacteria bacterium]|nr:flagellar biosynthesis protein FlhA [Deltaproteobacteria bacterium]
MVRHGLRWLGRGGNAGDIAIAALVVGVVAMMIVPLTPPLIDLLISVNICISVLVLALALFIRQPLSFSALPTVLLVATLYRLALNVASTRLILLKADAGRIIFAFGGFVVGGDILVGAVIFGILAMVLFLVITKGAERVAEVAARFTLDALPGMQLAIDGDLRAGAVSVAEAARRRAELDRESHYYGALDGAMKFVRGDAIASLVIIVVNIAGGLAVGVLRRGMGAAEALDTYGRLTVGDGLVTMIPALLVSTAAGLLVTRVGQGSGDRRLGEEIVRQVTSEPRAMAAAGALMLLLALAPGLPAWPFALLGAALVAGAVAAAGKERARPGSGTAEALFEPAADDAPAVLELGADLLASIVPLARARGGLRELSRDLARPSRDDLGIPLAEVPVVGGGTELGEREARLTVRRVAAFRFAVPVEAAAVEGTAEALAAIGIDRPTLGPSGLLLWVQERDAALARAAGLSVLDPLVGLEREVGASLRARAGRLVGLDETQALVDRVAAARPVLVRETVPKVVSLPALSKLLAHLADDGLSLALLPEILEGLAREPARGEGDDLVSRARRGLAPAITARLLDGRDALEVAVLGDDVEAVLERAVLPSSQGPRLALSPESCRDIAAACVRAAGGAPRPIFLVKPHLRPALGALVAPHLPSAAVVAHGEIEMHVPVRISSRVEV